jgi:signal transduction histidine kinase
MSYRSIKRLLGETGLEVKCRLLFGTGLLLLITGSFYFYSKLNLGIVHEQQRERAHLLIRNNVLGLHWKKTVDLESADLIGEVLADFKPGDPEGAEGQIDQWKFIPVDYDNKVLYDAAKRPSEQAEIDAFKQIVDQGAPYVVRRNPADDAYEYYEAVTERGSCSKCHGPDGSPPFPRDRLLGMAKITFPLHAIDEDIGYNNAILVAMAIVTAVIAIVAASVIVRYVIVKPVQHLNQVSEAIAHGDLDQRADIRTGDDFEELSHAFNRMLRHLVTIQDELRQVNTNLDAKVDELAQANLSLHEMNKLKSEFLATMSHELRTPLNSILGFSDVLGSAENLNDRQKKYLSNIRTSGQHLLALINDILDLAKIEAGKMEVHPGDVVVHELVESVAASMLPLAERKNIDLRWDVDPDVPVLFQDPGKLQQVLNNLVSNAVKFTPEGGRIRIRAVPAEEGLFGLVVADTGIGIPLEDQARIFDKFRQGRNVAGHHDTLSRDFEGTGLGLSIVKELCKLLGGEISVESEFGKGSTFTVRLPVEAQTGLSEPDVEFGRNDGPEMRRTRAAS